MRIIAGAARGKRLQEFDGQAVRPTSDRAREALFSMLSSRLPDWTELQVLDLFAGIHGYVFFLAGANQYGREDHRDLY